MGKINVTKGGKTRPIDEELLGSFERAGFSKVEAGPSLQGTLPEKSPQFTSGTERTLDQAPSPLANFQNVLKNITQTAYEAGPTPTDILKQYESAGVKLTTPSAIGAGINQGLGSRAEKIGRIFDNALDLIKEQERTRTEFGTTLLQNLPKDILFGLSADEFTQIKTGIITPELQQKLADVKLEGEKLTIQELQDVNSQLSADQQLSYGATKSDLEKIGFKPQAAGSKPVVLKEGDKLVNPETGEIILSIPTADEVATAAGELTEEQKKTLNQLQTTIRQDLDIKGFVDVKDAYERVVASGVDPSAAGDLALIFNFMKVLDPGSTVREGEFANAQNAGAIDDKTMSLYNRIVNGERLSDSQRDDFLDRAKRLYQPKLESYKKSLKFYQNQAETLGVPKDLIARDLAAPPTLEEIIGSLPALNQSYNSLESLVQNNPEYIKAIEQIGSSNPSLKDEDILQILSTPTNFNNVGSDTNIAAQAAAKTPAGSYGDECGIYSRKLVDFPHGMGDKWSEKQSFVKKHGILAKDWTKNVKVGDVIFAAVPNNPYGHVAVVNAILPNGKIQLSESNYRKKYTVDHSRIIDINSPNIFGAVRGKLKIG